MMKTNFHKESMMLKANSERYSILQSVKNFKQQIKENDLVLSVGDGPSHYRPLFKKYIGFDISKSLSIDFMADIYRIPIKSNSIPSIINIQVMEHLKYPEKALKELNRIMKPGGKMLITAPQGCALHDEPYDFFRYTPYSLKFLLEESDFEVKEIKPRGGYFWYLANRLKHIEKFSPRIIKPFVIALFSFFIPLIFFYLDKVDKEKKLTLGYSAIAIKKE
jgi:SAM-dependent methyltransferase